MSEFHLEIVMYVCEIPILLILFPVKHVHTYEQMW